MNTEDQRRGYIYVASSWRNTIQPNVVSALRGVGFDVYDFKNPPGGSGFAWEEVGLEHTNPLHGDPGAPDLSVVGDFLRALEHPRAVEGFESDFDAMQRADVIVAVAPCGKSAHLELGWGAGNGKYTAVLLDDPCTPELMYLMTDHLAPNLDSLMEWLDEVLPVEGPRVCRGCGCTDLAACRTFIGPCSWQVIYEDHTGICTACRVPETVH